ncbi:hypothetical protein ACFFJN_14135 [Erwinia mallotivora]|uniref:hypothetical protein n=1 Tax=Erwinia mallotivora TaxID=69222 RepID=UPI0035EDC23D
MKIDDAKTSIFSLLKEDEDNSSLQRKIKGFLNSSMSKLYNLKCKEIKDEIKEIENAGSAALNFIGFNRLIDAREFSGKLNILVRILEQLKHECIEKKIAPPLKVESNDYQNTIRSLQLKNKKIIKKLQYAPRTIESMPGKISKHLTALLPSKPESSFIGLSIEKKEKCLYYKKIWRPCSIQYH